jgi:CRISPR-associated endonuclease/helicase Cas3
MIEAVYDPDGHVPPELADGQARAEGARYGAESLANRNLIDVEEGYAMVGELSADEEIGTRLGEPTVTVRLARVGGERPVPWAYDPGANAPPGMRDWALSEVRVRTKWLGEVRPPPIQARLIDLTKRDWPEWDRNVPVLVVGSDGTVANTNGPSLTYGAQIGLSHVAPPTRG